MIWSVIAAPGSGGRVGACRSGACRVGASGRELVHAEKKQVASTAATAMPNFRRTDIQALPPTRGTTLVRVAEPDYRGRAAAGIAALQRWYRPRTGLWAGTGWWNGASALTTVIRYTQMTGDASHAGVIATTFTAAQRRH